MPLLNAWLAFLGSITKLPFHNQPPSPGSKTTSPEALKRALQSMKGSVKVLSNSDLWDNRCSNIPMNSLSQETWHFPESMSSWPRKVGWLGDESFLFIVCPVSLFSIAAVGLRTTVGTYHLYPPLSILNSPALAPAGLDDLTDIIQDLIPQRSKPVATILFSQ